MIKFRRDVVDQEIEEGEISGDFNESLRPSPALVVQSRPDPPANSESQSGSQEYVIERIKIDTKTPLSARKKERKEHKLDQKISQKDVSKKRTSKSPQNGQLPPQPPQQPSMMGNFYPNHPQKLYPMPVNEYGNIRIYQPQYPPFPSYIPIPHPQHQPQFFGQPQPQQMPQMKPYQNQWNPIRSNPHIRMQMPYMDDPHKFYMVQNNGSPYQAPRKIQQPEGQNPVQSRVPSQQNERKENEKKNKEREKRQERKKKVEGVKKSVKEFLDSAKLVKEDKEKIIALVKEAIQMESPSEEILDFLENYTGESENHKQTVEGLLRMLQGDDVLERLKERSLLRRIVGEKKLMETEEIFDMIVKDPRRRRV